MDGSRYRERPHDDYGAAVAVGDGIHDGTVLVALDGDEVRVRVPQRPLSRRLRFQSPAVPETSSTLQ